MSGILNPAVLVLGASGTVGTGVVSALQEAGSPVIAVARNERRLAALGQRFSPEPGLELLPGSVASDSDAARLAARISGRPLRAIVACVAGPVECGSVLGQASAVLQRKIELDLLPHLAAARHLLPLLAETDGPAHYILICATGAECGWAGYGHHSVIAAAQRMLAVVLHEEAAALGVRLQMLSLDRPIGKPGPAGMDRPHWPSALSVGRCAVSLMLRDKQPVHSVVRFADTWVPPPHRLFPAPSPVTSPAETLP